MKREDVVLAMAKAMNGPKNINGVNHDRQKLLALRDLNWSRQSSQETGVFLFMAKAALLELEIQGLIKGID